jgi:RNA polymerase sigma factor (sigma-70 family)
VSTRARPAERVPTTAPVTRPSPEFEAIYRANVGAIAAFFARRCGDPHTVADLTSETFVQAIASLRSFDARKGPARPWLFGIARRVYARHCAQTADGREADTRLAGQLTLNDDEIEEVAAKIDAQSAGRVLLERCARLPELERAAIELVDLAGLPPREAAKAMNVSAGALRVRLFRARARLRKGAASDEQL